MQILSTHLKLTIINHCEHLPARLSEFRIEFLFVFIGEELFHRYKGLHSG